MTPFCNPEELISFYDKEGIDKAVLLPVVNAEIYFPQSNDEILEICAAYPDRFIPYCNIDPRAMTNAPNAPLHKVLEYYKNKGCKKHGIKLGLYYSQELDFHEEHAGGVHYLDPWLKCDWANNWDFPDKDWDGLGESCVTMNHTWGYKSFDNDWKSADEIMAIKEKVNSHGVNLLLNVGPDYLGRIPAPSVEILKEIGRRLRALGK